MQIPAAVAGALSLLLSSAALAQTSTEQRPDIGEPAAVPDGAPQCTDQIDRLGLRDHAYWLADDARNGRQTASSGQVATAKYVADHFKSLGLKALGDRRGFLQHYPIERLEISKSTGLTFGKHKIRDGFAVLHASKDDKVSASGAFAYCGNGVAIRGSMKGRIPVVVLSGKTRGGVGGEQVEREHHAGVVHANKPFVARAILDRGGARSVCFGIARAHVAGGGAASVLEGAGRARGAARWPAPKIF